MNDDNRPPLSRGNVHRGQFRITYERKSRRRQHEVMILIAWLESEFEDKGALDDTTRAAIEALAPHLAELVFDEP